MYPRKYKIFNRKFDVSAGNAAQNIENSDKLLSFFYK